MEAEIMNACAAGEVHVVKGLLAVDPERLSEVRDQSGHTLLMIAVEWPQIHLVRYLLQEANIDVNARSLYGRTALMIACEKGFISIAKLLVEAGANYHDADDLGRSVLIRACRESREYIVYWLLTSYPILSSTSLRYTDKYRRTVLHYLCLFGSASILFLFLLLPSLSLENLTQPDSSTLLPALFPSRKLPIQNLLYILRLAVGEGGKDLWDKYLQIYEIEVERRRLLLGYSISGVDFLRVSDATSKMIVKKRRRKEATEVPI